MRTFNFQFASKHRLLYRRCKKPILAVSVFLDAREICVVDMNSRGEFEISLPAYLAHHFTNDEAGFYPEVADLPQDDPGRKILVDKYLKLIRVEIGDHSGVVLGDIVSFMSS